MILVKKLSIAPLFLLTFVLLIYQLNPLFASYEVIFSLSWAILIQFIVLSSLILLSSLMFNLFAILSQDWKLVLPVGLVAALIPLVLITQPLGVILAVGTLASIFLTYLTLESRLKNYLTFEPKALLGPSIRYLAGLLVLTISLTYFLSINQVIQKQGFQIPDSLIDASLKLASPQSQSTNQQQEPTQPSLTKEQIDLLKKNPDLLREYGLDPKLLDALNQPTQSVNPPYDLTNDLIKQTVKDQLQDLIKPYIRFIPATLAVILFLTLQSLVSLFTIVIYPLLWLIFYILGKTGYIKFVVEQRPVKKMVI